MAKFATALMGTICLLANSLCASQQTEVDIETQRLVHSNNVFGWQCFQNIKDSEGNFSFSPFSISSALAMAYSGARGDTQKAMGKVLGFKEPEVVNKSFSWLNAFFTRTSSDLPSDFRLIAANSMWLQTGKQLLPEFSEQVTRFYKAPLRRVDFMRQTETARAEINNWARAKTMGKITDLVGPDAVNPNTRLVLASALYMKARWQNLFDKQNTTLQPFFRDSGETLSVPSMVTKADFGYYSDDAQTAIELPYIHPKANTPKLALLVVFAHEDYDFNLFQKTLSTQQIKNWLDRMQTRHLLLYLPKFSVTTTLGLASVLSKMGMEKAFSPEADFSGIDGAKDLAISQVAHKVFVAADEGGTEAAAATAVTISRLSLPEEREATVVRVDRPFVFLIYEKTTGSILFMGRIINPLE